MVRKHYKKKYIKQKSKNAINLPTTRVVATGRDIKYIPSSSISFRIERYKNLENIFVERRWQRSFCPYYLPI